MQILTGRGARVRGFCVILHAVVQITQHIPDIRLAGSFTVWLTVTSSLVTQRDRQKGEKWPIRPAKLFDS